MSPLLVRPRRFEDPRGWFSETWNRQSFAALGITCDFVQDNQSLSRPKGTLRGLHFQTPPYAQSKLVRCVQGRIFDVAVDVRRDSPTFGRWVGAELSADNGLQLFVPQGYAHGFVTLEDDCLVAYKVDAFYSAESDGGVLWNDPAIGIEWPIERQPILSTKDEKLPHLESARIDFPYDGVPLGPLVEATP